MGKDGTSKAIDYHKVPSHIIGHDAGILLCNLKDAITS